MTDRVEADQLGVTRAAEACWSLGVAAGGALDGLLSGLTKEAIAAASGDDDFGRPITKGWVDAKADQYPEWADAIQSTVLVSGDNMMACWERVAATDGDNAQQVRAVDLGLTLTDKGWGQIPPPDNTDPQQA